MSQEIFCTSAPKGLRPGTKGGFCTVAATEGMSGALAEQLERLSGYRSFYPVGHPDQAKNPVSYAHWRIQTGGRTASVLSRVSFAIDYSRRTSRFAHHVVLDPSEQSPAGPAWVMMRPGLMESEWTGEPRYIEGRNVPTGDSTQRVCTAWQAATGDAGWAGALAEAFVLDASCPAYILYTPGTNLLPLMDEAISLLPRELRWLVTFNTYFTALPGGLECTWRCSVVGSDAAKDAQRFATSGVVIDLTQKPGQLSGSKYVQRAHTGGLAEDTAESLDPNEPLAPLTMANASSGHDVKPDSVVGRHGTQSESSRIRRRLSGPTPSVTPYDTDSADLVPGTGLANLTADSKDGGARFAEGSHRSRSAPAAFWLIAILWPLVVAVAASALWLRHRRALPDQSDVAAELEATRTRLSDETNLRREAEAIATKATSQAITLEAELAKQRQDAAHQAAQAVDLSKYVLKSVKDESDAEFTRRLRAKDIEIAAAKSRQNPSVPTSQAAPTPSRIERAAITEAGFPTGLGDDEEGAVLAAAAEGEAISLLFPNAKESIAIDASEDLKAVSTADGLKIFRQKRDALTRKAAEDPQLLAVIRIKEDKARWYWQSAYSDVLEKHRDKAVNELLRYSALLIGEKKDRIQFVPPNGASSAWAFQGNQPIGKPDQLPPAALQQLRILLRKPAEGWKVLGDTTLLYESADVGFKLTLTNGILSSDCENRLREMRKQIADVADEVKRIQREIRTADNQIKKLRDLKDQLSYEVRDRISSVEAGRDESKREEMRLVEQKTALDQAVHRLGSFPPITLDVEMHNGVRLGTVEMAPPKR